MSRGVGPSCHRGPTDDAPRRPGGDGAREDAAGPAESPPTGRTARTCPSLCPFPQHPPPAGLGRAPAMGYDSSVAVRQCSSCDPPGSVGGPRTRSTPQRIETPGDSRGFHV
ncbi:hypothetical protein FM110_09500 [Brachybacterium nesterenkovii]|uniref:Uncharacterized protein n=1 Tax=Brachybacterium nesterenkovii TaxID=47847 RepID=A0A1X6X360_9MICO|nr:hypothetical protein FM110_09500 [Brachybacterium nesterenkovii]